MIGFVGKTVGYVIKKSLPYVLVFSLGAVAGSGILSKKKNQDYPYQQVTVSDEQGTQYIVDLKTKTLEGITNNYQKRDSKLVELLK